MTPESVITTHRDVFYRSILEQDWDTLAHLYADDYVLVCSDGSVLTKGEVLADLRAQKLVFESIEMMDVKVRLIDSVAVLTARSQTVSRQHGAQMTSSFRLVAVYMEEANGSKLLHLQSTPLSNPPAASDQLPRDKKGYR
jgi:ketosteroid isomerase-like protein